MAHEMWIDSPDEAYAPGSVGFLVSRTTNGVERYELRDRPACENISLQPRLTGWCGETNNCSITAHGMVCVQRIVRNGRMLVASLAGVDLETALEELGYPELMPDYERET